MSIDKLITGWRADPEVAANIVAWQEYPSRPASLRPLPAGLHPSLVAALGFASIFRLYSHQAESWEQVNNGKNIAVVTGTASGKTWCYNLPVLDALLKSPQSRALYLFPTKALAQDQAQNLRAFLSAANITAFEAEETHSTTGSPPPLASAVYDGDTPAHTRPAIRDNSRLVISNPDMLHTGILPHHTIWAEFFRNLRFVVIDEIHIYRGVFGSHVANVLRRLTRIAHFYGAYPQFILTSATIANPGELAEKLIEEPVTVIDQDGSARGARHFLIYNPPVVNRDLGLRRSALQESVRLTGDLLDSGVQTIIFGRSRRTVELVLTYLRQNSHSNSPAARPKNPNGEEGDEIRGYRSGYLPGHRRAIEHGLRQGQVRAVVATNALELGIDIGGMGASVLLGYPGTMAATWQQTGRAGRGNETALAMLIATPDPLDQFLAHHPDYFFKRSVEQALVNPDHLLVLLDHLRCAAFEMPFQIGERFGRVAPERLAEFLAFLKDEGVLHQSAGRYFWMADQYPAQAVSLRSASVDTVVLQAWNEGAPTTLGQVDRESAHWMVHPQAVYLHEGQTYLVEDLDLEQNIASLKRMETDYYTEPRSETTVQLIEKLDEKVLHDQTDPLVTITHGEIQVTSLVIGYRKVKWYSHEQLGLGEVNLPPTDLQTTGYWLALSDEMVNRLQERGVWNSAVNNYGPNWAIQRDRARQRDGYRCQVCGAPELGRSHDVHHKIPLRTFASFEQANQLANLITLCPVCHRRAETAVRVRTGLGGLGFVLSNLAPFFLMCDARDLGVHTDPQSPLADGKPVVVLYDQVPAGIGFSQRLFELHSELMQTAYQLVASCECLDGCPSCVGPGGENGAGSKKETLAILELLCEANQNTRIPFVPGNHPVAS